MMKLGPEPPATVVTTHNMCDKDVTTWSSLLFLKFLFYFVNLDSIRCQCNFNWLLLRGIILSINAIFKILKY